MAWIQLILQTDKASIDSAEQALLDAGALSVTFRDAEDQPVLEPLPGETPLWEHIILTGLFEANTDTDALKQQVHAQLDKQYPLKIEALEDKDWVRAWMDDYKPMQFGKRLWVCPRHLTPPQTDGVNLMLDPGLAFGTGTHPTTALCLQWLDEAELENRQLLDFGCGSGVLAIAGLLLGADHCDATDIDPQAIIASQDNATINQVDERLDLFLVNEMPSHRRYDIVLANILAGPLSQLAQQLATYCKTGGHIVLSGILESQAEKILQAYSPWFELDPVCARDEWVRITGRKKQS